MGKAKGPRKKTLDSIDDLGGILEKFQKSLESLDKLEELEKALEPTGSVKVSQKQFEIDTDNIQTLDDVREVIKAMQMTIMWYQEDCPEKFKELYNRGLLKEKSNETI